MSVDEQFPECIVVVGMMSGNVRPALPFYEVHRKRSSEKLAQYRIRTTVYPNTNADYDGGNDYCRYGFPFCHYL